jgi:hypothetical protein
LRAGYGYYAEPMPVPDCDPSKYPLLKYKGWWEDDQPNGLGKMCFPSGDTYFGFFENGKMKGQGKNNIYSMFYRCFAQSK